ncbi:hypothetical protein [Proteiniphilum saccharofermentans]|uniref:hypothetical protein n=1 Tax=Proteiniphilum saccharofermentans TaxID=1642647 RepID=UPI0028AF0280|nr:hypothetical protein [Proteiniphilum saccharofermentans]
MALDGLIKKQTIIIDDHKRGSQEVKNWDDPSSDIHIDKTTNFPLDGKIQKVRIRIPINSDRPIKIENEKRQEVNEIPRKLHREINRALENKQIRNSFISEVMDVLDNFETALSNEDKAKSVLTRISKHFGLDWPTETIANYAKDVLLAYTLVYQKNPKEEYFAKIDKHKIEIGQYSGYAKQLRKLNR